MRVHYFQHVPFEGLGSIAAWLEAAGAEITATRFFEKPEFPEMDDIDLLIVMGGPMSINDEEIYPWLAPEKAFIKQAVLRGKAVLGICLGAQLLAGAFGAKVYPNAQKEIGWFPVRAVADAQGEFRFPQEALVFHWHGETFDLPPEAALMASSAACKNQAFRIGKKVFGLQFHLETTPESAQAIVEHCRDELKPAAFVESEADILRVPPENHENINRLMTEILTFITKPETA